MRLGVVVSDLALERPVYTTITVVVAALRAGHDVCFIDVADFSWRPDGSVGAFTRAAALPSGENPAPAYLDALLRAPRRRIELAELDLLWLRAEPSFDPFTSPDVPGSMGFPFAQAAADAGLPAVSDPRTLAAAIADKAYSQRLALAVRPRTLVTRDAGELAQFVADLGRPAVIKPLHGAGGQSVFTIAGPRDPNLGAAIEAIQRFGYVVAQEYLPAAAGGVLRLFMLDGEPLTVDGVVAAMRHVPREGDPRSNFRVSGSIAPAGTLDDALRVAAAIGPRLAADGLFLVGLDIVGDRLLEANVFSAGGLRGVELLTGAPFSATVVRALADRAR